MAVRVNPQYMLAAIEAGADKVIFTTAEVTDHAAAVAAKVGELSLLPSDFTVAVGDAAGDSGKISLVEQNVTWTADGVCSHAAFFDGTVFIICSLAGLAKQIYTGDAGVISAFKVWEVAGNA